MRALLAVLVWLFAAAVAATPVAATSPATTPLAGAWEFRLAPDDAQAAEHAAATTWRPARTPGFVHTDLHAAGLIPDPYVGAPEPGLQWIGLARWEYRTRFDMPRARRAMRQHELVFDGLDTFADVYLNGAKLLSADNAFRTWRIPVEGKLRARGNELRVVFHSPIRRMLPKVQAMPHKIAGNYPSPHGDEPADAMTGNFVRKPGYHYGWDWGPRYVTAGIWRDVRIESWNGLRADDMVVRQKSIRADAADLDIGVTLIADRAGPASVRIGITGPGGAPLPPVTRDVMLVRGANDVTIPVRIAHPHRWYPVGYGAQALYRVAADVQAGEQRVRIERRTGLRTVELRRDIDDRGQGFAFVINGIPIFAKGANFIPFDAFATRATTADKRKILESAVAANMNMLRAWGGGYYEDDAFYNMADEMGLLIWQDFMFGGGMQPGYDPAFRANVVAEARDQVRRLRNHPSIVLWCGNNEEETAWKDWGQGKALTAADPAFAAKVWEGYKTLFGTDLRAVVAEEGNGIPYWSSSPSNDLDVKANDSLRGDKHYWGVWGGSEPVEAFLSESPRFMSEFGLQSWPEMRTVNRVIPVAEQQIDSATVRAHQKFNAGKGNDRLLHYIRAGYGEPRDFAHFVYLSQVMQAEGIELGALHHRSSRPWTMGTLYWQLNDVWPGASWSGIDYYGNWKALNFHARRFFAPIAVAALRQEGRTRFALISDRTTPVAGQWRVRVIDFDGTTRMERSGSATLDPLGVTAIGQWRDADLLRAADPARTAAVFELWVDGQARSRQVVYFRPAKELALDARPIAAQLVKDAAGLRIDLTATQLARGVWIDFGDTDVTLSDNALTLLPGERVSIRLDTAANLNALERRLNIQFLGQKAR